MASSVEHRLTQQPTEDLGTSTREDNLSVARTLAAGLKQQALQYRIGIKPKDIIVTSVKVPHRYDDSALESRLAIWEMRYLDPQGQESLARLVELSGRADGSGFMTFQLSNPEATIVWDSAGDVTSSVHATKTAQ